MADLTIPECSRRLRAMERRMLAAAIRANGQAEDGSPGAIRARVARARSDRFFFYAHYLPHLFPEPCGPAHRRLAHALDAHPVLLVLAFRGWGKSTVVTLAETLRLLVLGEAQFTVLTGRTRQQTAPLVLQLRLELEHNARLRQDFGPLERGGIWQAGHFALANGQEVLGRSLGASARGPRSLRNRRPQLWVLDDLQELADARNPQRIQATLDFIQGVVLPALARPRRGSGEPPARVRIVGTKMSDDCAIARLERDPAVPTFRLDAEDGQFGHLADARRFPARFLRRQRALLGSDAYQREYLNHAVGREGLVRRQWIRTFRAAELAGLSLRCAVYWDPAAATGGTGDYKAIISLGLHAPTGRLYVLRAFIERQASPAEQAGEFCRQWQAVLQAGHDGVIGYEANGFQLLMEYPLEAQRLALGLAPLPLRPVVNTTNKELRVGGLVPLIERGQLLFLEGDPAQALLVEQWLYWPRKGQDGPDALCGAWQLLQQAAAQGAPLVTYREEHHAWLD